LDTRSRYRSMLSSANDDTDGTVTFRSFSSNLRDIASGIAYRMPSNRNLSRLARWLRLRHDFANRSTGELSEWTDRRMRDVDIDTRTDRPDGWKQRTSWREGAQKFILCTLFRLPVALPHILARAPPIFGRALYTLHNDVYPVSTTGTIVPKVNI